MKNNKNNDSKKIKANKLNHKELKDLGVWFDHGYQWELVQACELAN